MRKYCSNVYKLRPYLATESTNSARMSTIVNTVLQRQYSQTELIFWTTLVVSAFPRANIRLFFYKTTEPKVVTWKTCTCAV